MVITKEVGMKQALSGVHRQTKGIQTLSERNHVKLSLKICLGALTSIRKSEKYFFTVISWTFDKKSSLE